MLSLTSPAFSHEGKIPARYTCEEEDCVPPLEISGAPEGTASFVLLVTDPDAPSGTWDHWVVFNIPPDYLKVEEEREEIGVSGKNSWGKLGYGGPCPPDGEHRYFFTLYALSAVLNLPEGSSREEVEAAMKDRVLEQAVLMGTYRKSS